MAFSRPNIFKKLDMRYLFRLEDDEENDSNGKKFMGFFPVIISFIV